MAFLRQRVAVFVDGDFWHGKDWDVRKKKLGRGHNPHYWIEKIEYNIQRDREVASSLAHLGWRVVRIWESDVKADPQEVTDMIAALLDERSHP